MKGISSLLIVFGFLAIAAQATYLRVIHAVPPGDVKMDVYYTAMDSGEKIRLFQDLNYTNIPPYFFIPVLQDNERVELSFLLKPSENSSEQLVSQQQLQGLPTHTVTLGKNLTYSLIVTSTSGSQGENQTQNQEQGQDQSQGQGNQTLEYLLLNDFNQEEVPEDFKLVRLINLAEDASPISLVDEMADCPQENIGGVSQENQTEGDQGSQDQSQDSQDQSQEMEPLVRDLAFLEASDYIDLPSQTQPQSLFVCHQGEKISVTPAPLFRASGSRFSILLFTGSSQMDQSQDQTQDQGTQDQGEESQDQSQDQTQDQGEETQDQSQDQTQDQGEETQGQGEETQDQSQDQGMEGQSQFVAYIVSDEPVTTQNVRIRIVHAESSLPSVNVMLDGEPLFQSVSFGNVTEYSMTVRGIHNISVSAQGQNMSTSSVRIVTFFAWMKSYSIAIVRTSSGEMGVDSQADSESQDGNQLLNQGGQEFEPMQGILFPGFQGNLHKIFVDEISQNSTLGSNYAYVQFIHLASNVGTVNVNVGNQNITNIRFLQSSQYRGVMASQRVPIEVLLASSNTRVFSLTTSLQPGTLYTLWALQDQSSQTPLIFLTRDRQIQIQCVVMDAEMMDGNQGQTQD